MSNKINLTDNLAKLQDIANWFDRQEQADVEEGLQKVKEAATLIKESKNRLKQIENEFNEIQSQISEELEDGDGATAVEESTVIVEKKDDDDMPF